uniref:Uncharacterized protein n=1 Tax=Arundo donax TaxID=35708 RepID=A0A0A8Z337_ARUDO
MHNNKQSKGP